MQTIRNAAAALCAVVFLAAAPAQPSTPAGTWVGSWAASQQLLDRPDTPDVQPDVTVRQIVRLTVGGNRLRLRLSNVFGTAPLHISSVHVALAGTGPQIVPGTDRAVTFEQHEDVTIPPGADYISDPVDFPVATFSNLAISFHLDELPAQWTGHPFSLATSYTAQQHFENRIDLPDAKAMTHWVVISGVDVEAPKPMPVAATLGDSITDGTNSTIDGNDRWPDFLAQRLAASGRRFGVLNVGLHGNRLLLDGTGPNALARFDRDVLARTGVRLLFVLEGTNDLGNLCRAEHSTPAEHTEMVRSIIAAYQQIIARAHLHGIRVVGATLIPDGGSEWYHPTPVDEADRQAVNQWIRTSGAFDAVVDFDAVIRDPANPGRMAAAFDSGDHLHPSDAGYRAMAEAVPLTLFDQ